MREYVKHVLDRLLDGEKDYAALRPDHWAAQHPEHIRVYHQDERRYRTDARQSRHAARRPRPRLTMALVRAYANAMVCGPESWGDGQGR